LDQNYQEVNYSDFSSKIKLENLNIDFNYIEENKHIGDQEYFKTRVQYNNKDKSFISFETKRNLVSNSSEFYDLSYEYINDCLRAGLVFRREFYNDSELESENSLMFNITLVPFGNINSPKINK
jgi:LPS-assembly protein